MSRPASPSPAAAVGPAAVPAGIRRSARYLPELESLRGVAILLVYAFHTNAYVQVFQPRETSLWYAFVLAGHTGVDLFFVLSAFLLSLPFLREAAGGRRVDRRRFFARRALRILPLYWTALVIALALRARTLESVVGALPRFVFFPSFVPPPSLLPAPPDLHPYGDVWWSLGTEAQFYLLLPLLPLVIGAGRRWRAWLCLGLYVLAYGLFLARRLPLSRSINEMFLSFSVFGRGSLFLSGITAAWLYDRYGDRIRAWNRYRWWRQGGADALLVGAVLLLARLLQWAVCCRDVWDHPPSHAWHAPEGVLWGLIVLLILLAPLRLRSLLHNRVLATLGVLSYSIYMLHAPLVQLSLRTVSRYRPLGGWSLASAVVTAVVSLGCVGLARITYRFIEMPFLREKARLDD